MIELDLEEVRAKAKELGVYVHPAQKAETIQFNIDKHLADKQALDAALAAEPVPVVEADVPTGAAKPQTPAQQLEELQKTALALIPITITSMDPADAQLTGTLVSVGNSVLGQITKAIPFGYKWYMPKILVDELETVMFTRNSMTPVPGVMGGDRLNTQWLKKYAITYHPLPTPAELAELAKAQAVGNELAK
jgi:hypothetical protein